MSAERSRILTAVLELRTIDVRQIADWCRRNGGPVSETTVRDTLRIVRELVGSEMPLQIKLGPVAIADRAGNDALAEGIAGAIAAGAIGAMDGARSAVGGALAAGVVKFVFKLRGQVRVLRGISLVIMEIIYSYRTISDVVLYKESAEAGLTDAEVEEALKELSSVADTRPALIENRNGNWLSLV